MVLHPACAPVEGASYLRVYEWMTVGCNPVAGGEPSQPGPCVLWARRMGGAVAGAATDCVQAGAGGMERGCVFQKLGQRSA
jgi:hypothetical protein